VVLDMRLGKFDPNIPIAMFDKDTNRIFFQTEFLILKGKDRCLNMKHSNIEIGLLDMNTSRIFFDEKYLEFRGSKEMGMCQSKIRSNINI